DQRVDGEQTERGRAVDEHVVDVQLVEHLRRQRLLEPVFPGHHADELDLRTREVDGGGHAEQVGGGRAGYRRVRQVDLVEERLVPRRRAAPVVGREARVGGAMR